LAVHVRSRLWFAAAPETSSSWIETLKRAKAVATDLRYGTPLCPKTTVVDGDYADLAEAALVMVTAGINERLAAPRIVTIPKVDCGSWIRTPRSIATSFHVLVHAAPGAVILVVTDPPDPLADMPASAQGMIVY